MLDSKNKNIDNKQHQYFQKFVQRKRLKKIGTFSSQTHLLQVNLLIDVDLNKKKQSKNS